MDTAKPKRVYFDYGQYYEEVDTKGWLDHEVDCICDDPSEYLCTQRLFEPECMCECHGGWE